MGYSKELRIRDAGAGDLETLARWNESMALETESLRLDPATIRAGTRAVLEDPSKGRYFVAEWDGAPAGMLMVTYEWSDWRNGVFFWIQSLYVAPAYRRRGVFKGLFRHVAALASQGGACGLRLYVHAENHLAREVYSRLGLEHNDYMVLETPDRLRNA